MGKGADFDVSAECAIDRKLGQMGLVSAPRTPLRALIAREAIWASELADPALVKSRVESGSGGLHVRDGWVVQAGSPSPPKAGSSSSPGIRVFKRAGVVRAVSLHSAERPVQLGALFAQEREDARRVAVEAPHVQPLRDFIACGARTPKTLRSPSPRDVAATKPVLAPDESQELRYLFAKDWALQTSDEEDEFWDSGSLCGAPIGSRHENPRRRSRFYKSLSSVSHPTSEPEIEIVEAHSPTFSEETVTSLGTLLGEETASSSRWSVPAAESSRRVKIASLDDISAPVRPESQSQLDFLIAKILTLRANSVTGNAEPIVSRLDDGSSMQTPAEEFTENLSPHVTVPATDVDPPSDDEIREVPTSPSTVVETPITVSAEGEEAASNAPDSEATPRVQLGALLERSWGEHGWLPLCRSQMSSPLVPSSSTNCESPVPSERVAVLSPPEGEPVEVVDVGEGDGAMAVRERAPTRVSLLSLLSQDMEADEDGVLADVLCGCRDEEEDEGATEELDPMCCVCMVGHKGAAFIPCGHTFCRKCCREVRRSIGSCPLCNQAIVDVLKLY